MTAPTDKEIEALVEKFELIRSSFNKLATAFTALQAENAKLREALKTYACSKKCNGMRPPFQDQCMYSYEGACGLVARAALAKETDRERA